MLATINPLKFYQDIGNFLMQNADKYDINEFTIDQRFIKIINGTHSKLIRMQDWFYAPVKDVFMKEQLNTFKREDIKNGSKNKSSKSGRDGNNRKGNSRGHMEGSDSDSGDAGQPEGTTEDEPKGTDSEVQGSVQELKED